MRIHYLLLVIISLCFSCNSSDSASDKELPDSISSVKKVLVVASDELWASSIGDSLSVILKQSYPGIIGKESSFGLNHIIPQKFNDLYNTQRIVIIPFVLGQNSQFEKGLSPEVIEGIKSGGVFILEKQDVWAKNQFVFFLVASTREGLMNKLNEHQEQLVSLLEDKAVSALLHEIGFKNRSLDLENEVKTKGLGIVIPENYKKVLDTTDFLWLRARRKDADLSIVISSKPYSSQVQFSDEKLIELRDSVVSLIFVDPSDTGSFMITERYVEPVISSLEAQNGFTKKMNGLWRFNNFRMGGGSFISYSFLNPEKTRQFYVEGFVFAPGKEKIPYLRKLDATLKSITFLKEKD